MCGSGRCVRLILDCIANRERFSRMEELMRVDNALCLLLRLLEVAMANIYNARVLPMNATQHDEMCYEVLQEDG